MGGGFNLTSFLTEGGLIEMLWVFFPAEPGGAGGGSLWPGPWWAERWGPDFTSCSLICTSQSRKNRRRTKVPSKTNMKS